MGITRDTNESIPAQSRRSKFHSKGSKKMSRQIRTDLAMESAGAAGSSQLPGVHVSAWESGDVNITEVRIEREDGARLLGKPIGTYITLECAGEHRRTTEGRRAVANLLGEELLRLLPEDGDKPVLVVGLGNRSVTPDALGPMTVDRTLVTRHIFKELPESVDDRMMPVAAVAPGVLGVTGIETFEMVQGIVKGLNPRAVIAVDSLSARSTYRIGSAVQLTDVGNHRRALTEESLGVKVLAVGVPMVIYAATIARDAMEILSDEDGEDHMEALDSMTNKLLESDLGEMIVTPREVDDLVGDVAQMLAGGINRALHPGLDEREILDMMGN